MMYHAVCISRTRIAQVRSATVALMHTRKSQKKRSNLERISVGPKVTRFDADRIFVD